MRLPAALKSVIDSCNCQRAMMAVAVAGNHDIRDTGTPQEMWGTCSGYPMLATSLKSSMDTRASVLPPMCHHECCLKWLTSWPHWWHSRAVHQVHYNTLILLLKKIGMSNWLGAMHYIACAFHTALLTCSVGSQDKRAEEAHALGAM